MNNKSFFDNNMMVDGTEIQNMLDQLKSNRPIGAIVPEEIGGYEGNLFGCFIEETNMFNVFLTQVVENSSSGMVIGCVYNDKDPLIEEKKKEKGFLTVVRTDDEMKFFSDGRMVERVTRYSAVKDVFKRNMGILDSDALKKDGMIIAGVGSGGSYWAVEAAKLGIGRFVLIDDDILSYGNLSRYQGGTLYDVGRFKTDVIRDSIYGINPNAEIYVYHCQLQDVSLEELEEYVEKNSNTILACAADNRHAGYICQKYSERLHIPFVSAGCSDRAETGEIFYYIPDRDMPCYECVFGKDRGVDIAANQQFRRTYYITEESRAQEDFYCGINLDVEYTAMIALRVMVDILLKDQEKKGYVPMILNQVGQYTITFNRPLSENNPYREMFPDEKPLSYRAVNTKRNPKCTHCGA